jgi:esterase/lipase superfamily enzyme
VQYAGLHGLSQAVAARSTVGYYSADMILEWISEGFLVLDAASPVRIASPALRGKSAKWVAVIDRRLSQPDYYVGRRAELLSLLRDSPASESLFEVLEGTKTFRRAIVVNTRGDAARFLKEQNGASATGLNFILLESQAGSGNDTLVKSIGLVVPLRTIRVEISSRLSVKPIFEPEHRGIVAAKKSSIKAAPRGIGRARKAAVHVAAPSPKPQNFRIIPVFFATDRGVAKANDGQYSFENAPSADRLTRYGICNVSVPFTHKLGSIESPSWLKLEFSADPGKHMTILATDVLDKSVFAKQLKDAIGGSSKKDALVFVHGFNVSFKEAALRTAQLAADLHFEGAPILYSWGSRGRSLAYARDEVAAENSAERFEEFLKGIVAKTGAKAIHIIAHSMGSRTLSYALQTLVNKGIAPALANVIFAAPDIDAERFAQFAKAIQGVPQRVTLYASSKDRALELSSLLHGLRAGLVGSTIVQVDGIDTIDASRVDSDFLGHGKFASTQSLLTDICDLIFRGSPPKDRNLLEPVDHGNGIYWEFKRGTR